MENNIRILSTASLGPAERAMADAVGASLDAADFIATHFLQDVWASAGLRDGAVIAGPLVFTSANAVRSVVASGYYPQAGQSVYCVGHATMAEVKASFPAVVIAGTGRDAATVAECIINAHEKAVTFFCGNLRMDSLPSLLANAGIALTEVVVYQTVPTPVIVKKDYDAILFFSPSGVASYFAINDIAPDATVFAIGRTTAAALQNACANKIIIAPKPEKAEVLRAAIEYFQKLAKEKQTNI